jgi:hypothetical protein
MTDAIADYIVSKLWRVATVDPSATAGKTGAQRRAFGLVLGIRGGFDFIAKRPAAELAELGRRGICSASLGLILRKMAGIELRRRRGLISASGFKAEMRSLILAAGMRG